MNAYEDLSPPQLTAALQAFMRAAGPLNLPHARAAFDVLEAAIQQARTPIVFRPARRDFGAEAWQIHFADQPVQVYPCALAGLTAAWLAIRDRGRSTTVRTCDFAAPGAVRADTVVRTAIRRTAHQWVLRATGCWPLAAALLRVEVRGGLVVYEPAIDAPVILTD